MAGCVSRPLCQQGVHAAAFGSEGLCHVYHINTSTWFWSICQRPERDYFLRELWHAQSHVRHFPEDYFIKMAQRQYDYHPGSRIIKAKPRIVKTASYLRPHTERRLGQISKWGLMSLCPGPYQKPQHFSKDQRQNLNKACDASERKTKDRLVLEIKPGPCQWWASAVPLRYWAPNKRHYDCPKRIIRARDVGPFMCYQWGPTVVTTINLFIYYYYY